MSDKSNWAVTVVIYISVVLMICVVANSTVLARWESIPVAGVQIRIVGWKREKKITKNIKMRSFAKDEPDMHYVMIFCIVIQGL